MRDGVGWWPPVVKGGLLGYQPAVTAQPAVDPETQRIGVATRDGVLHSLSPVNGKTEWEFKTNSRFFAGVTIDQGVVYVPGGDGILYALRAATGEKLWEYKAGEELVTSPVVKAGRVLVASQGDTLYVGDTATGKWMWQYRPVQEVLLARLSRFARILYKLSPSDLGESTTEKLTSSPHCRP